MTKVLQPDLLLQHPEVFWKRSGDKSHTLYCGPVVIFSTRYQNLELASLIGVVPDNTQTLWVWSSVEHTAIMVKDEDVALPLRFRGNIYEEGANRTKDFLVDKLFPTIPKERRINISWTHREGEPWVLDLGGCYNWTFGSGTGARHTMIPMLETELDPFTALFVAANALAVIG